MFKIHNFMCLFLLSKNRNSNTNILVLIDLFIFDIFHEILDDVDLFFYSLVIRRNLIENIDPKIFFVRYVAIWLDVFGEIEEEDDVDLASFADAVPAVLVNIADSAVGIVVFKMAGKKNMFCP